MPPRQAPPAAIDPSNAASCYYVHPNENPAISLVTKPLTPHNYHSWARLMKKALIGKNKFKFADGSIPMPDSFDPLYDAWERCNNLVHSWIINSVSPQIAQSIVYKELASDAWKNLKSRFERVDRVRVVDLKYEIYQLKQESLSVTDFFSELSILIEELDNYRPRPDCTCAVRCSCAAMRNAQLFHDEDIVMCFLKGLNDNFAMVRSQILLMNPLPSITTAFSMVIEHERQNGLCPAPDETSPQINAVEGKRPFNRGKPSGPRHCTFCNRQGHTVDTCYKKHLLFAPLVVFVFVLLSSAFSNFLSFSHV